MVFPSPVGDVAQRKPIGESFLSITTGRAHIKPITQGRGMLEFERLAVEKNPCSIYTNESANACNALNRDGFHSTAAATTFPLPRIFLANVQKRDMPLECMKSCQIPTPASIQNDAFPSRAHQQART